MAGLPNDSAGLDPSFGDSHGNTNDLSVLVSRTQANVEAEYKTQVQTNPALNAASSTFFDFILAGFESLTELVEALALAITGVVGGTISSIGDFIGDLVTDLADAFDRIFHLNDLYDLLESIVNQIGDAFDGLVVTPINTVISAIVDWISELFGWRKNTENNQTNSQNFQITQLTTTAYANPRWVCRYPVGDVTFPESMIYGQSIFGNTGAASTGTAHTHTGGTLNLSAPGMPISEDQSVGAIISVSNTAAMDTFEFFGAVTSGTVDSAHVDIFRIAADGSSVRISTVNVTSLLSASYGRITVTLPSTVVVQAGEKYYVRVRNSSSATSVVRVVSLESAYTYLDDVSLKSSVYADTVKTVYTSAEMTTLASGTAFTMWACLASANPTLTDVSFSDDFNRATLGGLWSLKSNVPDQLSIWANRATYTAASSGAQNGLYVWRTSREGNRVEGNIYVNAFANSGQRVGLTMHCNRDFSQMVYLGVGKTAVNIYSGSSTSLTSRATISSTNNDGLWSLHYDVPNDKYVALKNGNSVGLEWTGVSTAVDHGAEYRFGGVRIECAILAAGGTIDNWTLRDFTA